LLATTPAYGASVHGGGAGGGGLVSGDIDTSAELATIVTNETGTGALVFGTGPTLDAPIITTKARLPRVTALPGTPSAGDTVIVTDDSAAGACDSAAGAATTLCQYNGSAWVALGDGGGAGSSSDGSATAVQASDGAGGFADSGCTASSGDLTCASITTSGAATGKVTVNGVTSGKIELTTADATAQTITVTGAAQTSGATTLTIPDMAGTNDTFMFAAKAVTKTNLTLDAEGTGNTITIKRHKWIPAAGCNNATAGTIWDLPASNPAVAACRTGTNTTKGVLEFADGASLSAQYTDFLVDDWSGNIDAQVVWQSGSTSTNNVVWQIAIACAGDADADDPAFTDDEFTADANKATANQYNKTASNTVTTTGTCAAGDVMHVRIKRDAAHASDNLAATAQLVGVYLKLREAQ
jgi:hypothetical protein